MQFTEGDYIALVAVGLTVIGFVFREWRQTISKTAIAAAAAAGTQAIILSISDQLKGVVTAITELERKRQKHEIDCAKIQERTAAAQERAAELLVEHGRAIGHLQAQMAHVATGSADTLVEIVPQRRRPIGSSGE